jgi:hypothetical protein
LDLKQLSSVNFSPCTRKPITLSTNPSAEPHICLLRLVIVEAGKRSGNVSAGQFLHLILGLAMGPVLDSDERLSLENASVGAPMPQDPAEAPFSRTSDGLPKRFFVPANVFVAFEISSHGCDVHWSAILNRDIE